MTKSLSVRGPDHTRRPADTNYLTRTEAAKYLGVSLSALAHWSCHGKGPVRKLVGRRTYYHLVDLDRWLFERNGVARGR